jgi:nucleotide-binding universal stress UspA family protein
LTRVNAGPNARAEHGVIRSNAREVATMPWKTIAVQIPGNPDRDAAITTAASLAAEQEAHLVGWTALGDPYVPAALGGEVASQYVKAQMAVLKEAAEHAVARFESRMTELRSRHAIRSHESRVIEGRTDSAAALIARYSDLMVLTQPERRNVGCGRPVLMVPFAGRFETVGTDVLLAWSATREAARTIIDALPALKRARIVRVLALNPDRSGHHGESPGADLAVFLARHGVRVEVHSEPTVIDPGAALLSRAADFGSDLLVMGAYGHSRWRETLLGGTTRTVLESMTIPVLMAH